MALLSETPLLKDIAAWTTAGRLTRARFGGALALWLAVMMAGFAAAWLGLRSGASPMLGGGLIAIGLWFAVCATARRLHDMSHSGFWAILSRSVLFRFSSRKAARGRTPGAKIRKDC